MPPPPLRQVLDQHRLEPTLKGMSAQPVRPVQASSVADVEPLHRLTEIGLWHPQQQVVVIVHQHERVNPDPKSLRQFRRQPKESMPIRVIVKQRLPPVAAGSHVIPPICHEYSQWSGHEATKPLRLELTLSSVWI